MRFKTETKKAKGETVKLKEDTAVEDLIDQMKALNLSDPKYRAFWAEVSRKDPELRRRLNELSAFTTGPAPSIHRDAPSHATGNSTVNSNIGTGDYNMEGVCYGCGRKGHTTTRCETLRALTEEKVIQRGATGRWTWTNGVPIVRRGDESIADVVNRGLKHVGLVTTPADVIEESEIETGSEDPDEEWNQQRTTYLGWREEDSSQSEEESGSEEGSTGRGRGRSRGRDRGTSRESEREAWVAERTEKVSKSARFRPNEKGNSQGATYEKGSTWGKSSDSRNVNSVPIHKNVNRRLGTDGVKGREPVSVGRKDVVERKEYDEDVPMVVDQEPSKDGKQDIAKNSRRHQGEMGREGGQVRTEIVEAASEVINWLMKETVTLPLGRLLRLAPELQRGLGWAVKGQPTREESGPYRKGDQGAAKPVKGTHDEKRVYLQTDWEALELSQPRGKLPKVEARVGNAKMVAIIDTGAMVNLISEKMYKRTGLAKNNDTLQLRDVNGGLKETNGMIQMVGVYLTPSKVYTAGDLWVIETENFDLLLGREWQTMNMAGIQETLAGTRLRFMSRGVNYDAIVLPIPEANEKRGDDEEEDRPAEGGPQRPQRQRTACVVEVEEEPGETLTAPKLDEWRGRRERGESNTLEESEGSGRSWGPEEIPTHSRKLRCETGRMRQMFLRTGEGSYLGEGEEEEREPGGNKWEWVAETPELYDEGSQADDEAEGGEESPRRKRMREESSEERKRDLGKEVDEESDYWKRIRSTE